MKNATLLAANNPSGKQASSVIGLDPTSAKRSYIAQNIDANDSNIFAIIVENLSDNSETQIYNAFQWRETR